MRNTISNLLTPKGRWLPTLLLLFTLGIGQMWADATIVLADVTPSSNWYEVSGVGRVTNKKGNAFSAGDYNCTGTGYKTGSSYFTVQTYTAITGLQITATSTSNRTVSGIAIGDAGASSAPSSFPSGASATGSIKKETCDQVVTINFGTTVAANKYISIGLSGNSNIFSVTFIAASVTKHSVTYDLNGGTGTTPTQADVAEGAKFTLHDGTTSITAPSGKEFAGWNDGTKTYLGGAEYTMGTSNVTLTAQWQNPAPKYSVTYVLNGPSGDAPTQASVAAGTEITLAAAPSWAGHAFDGWLCSADAAVKAAGASYTMTAANTTFTAQWHEVDCKIYSLTGGIGSAEGTAGDYEVSASALILKNSNTRIKLTPAGGETFKAGDVITISGYTGNAAKKFGVYVKNAAGSSNIATAEETTLGDGFATATLSADADYVFLARKESTTMNVLTCEIHRSCAAGEDAGLSYATAEVNKTEGDAAFTNALTNANGLVIAGYSSSNAAVATVASNGQVTIVAPGAATITAHSAVQTKAGTLYAAGTATYTLNVAALPTYTVTYDLNGGSGTPSEADHKAGEKFNLHDGVTGITAPTNKTFVNWKDQDEALFDGGAEYTMPANNVTLTAQWAGDVYTVKYMDGEDLLDTKVVEVGSHPADITHPTKPLFTFASWQLSGSDVVLDDVNGTKDAEIILTARWAKAYGNNVDFEAYILANTSEKDDVDKAEAYVLSQNYALSTKTGTTFDSNNSSNNGSYAGLKIKNSGTVLRWNVAAGKVVEFKAGIMVANGSLSINGGAATTIDGGSKTSGDNFKKHYFYSAAEALYEFTTSSGDAEVVKAITMRDPYTVSFEAHGDADPSALQGLPSVTLPDASNGTASLLGWFDAETGGNKIGDAGDTYIPTANITLHAQWEAISTDNTLSDLKVGGETVDGFSPTVHTYYVVLPYGTKPENIPAISATANSAKAKQVAIQQAVWTDAPYNCYRAQANVQAEDESWGYYDVRFSFAPKDGVSIIKVATTGGSNKTVTGAYAGDGDVNLSSSTKMDNGKYIGFILDGTTLQAGDRINVHTTEAANTGGSHIIFYDNMTDKNELYETGEIGGTGNNIFTINAAMVGHATAYVYRANNDAAHQWNGKVNFIEVTRAMNPVLTAITFDGVDGEQGVGNTFSATLPNGTILADMTVVPTIVKNGEGGSAAPTAAWAWGANTYRVTDKDGDYTDYTITLTEAAAPSAAPVITAQPAGANYLEGATIAALEVVATGESLTYQWYLGSDPIDGATTASYSPTVSAIGTYVYHCVVTNTEAGHPATSLASDDATITISEDPAAIKLLDGEGNVNTTDFITGVSKNTVTYGEVEHNCATFGSTASTAVGASGLNKFIIYNAKTDQTKIKFVLYNTQNSAQKLVLQKLEEGGDAMEEIEIDVPSKEEFTTEYYTYTSSANRTMYAFVKNTGIKVLQVKVIDNGTALKQFGEVGYSINFNQGRLFLNSGTDGAYDGLTYNAASNFAPLSSTGLSLTKNKAYRFNVPAAATMTVTAANNAKYYITQTEDGEDNETAVAAATSFDLTAGTWYLRVAGSNLSVTNIAFAAPKCAEPVIDNEPESNTNFGPGNLTATVVAHATDGADLSYQWYDADDNEVAGATDATLTTTTPGEYYVIITASKAGYDDRSVQSANATLGYRDITIATLSALSYGGTAITLEADKYEYRVDLPEGTTDVPALAATATQASYGATAVPTDAAEFISYEAISTVLVTAEDGTTTQTYTVHFYVDHEILALVDVTGNIKWDFSKDGLANNASVGTDVIMANVDGVVNNDDFHSDNIMVTANKQSGTKLQASMVKFHTTINGFVEVKFSHTGSNKTDGRALVVNGTNQSELSHGTTVMTYNCYVPAGDVVLTVTTGDGGNMLNFTSVEFLPAENMRDVTPGKMGTFCTAYNVTMFHGAEFFVPNQSQNSMYIEFVSVDALEAGHSYLYIANANAIEVVNEGDAVTTAVEATAARGMVGYLGTGTQDIDNVPNNIVVKNNHLYYANNNWLTNGRAYIDKSVVDGLTPMNNAPGRRLVVGFNQNPTGIEDIISDAEGTQKVIMNGQLYILRDGKMYNAQGQLMK